MQIIEQHPDAIKAARMIRYYKQKMNAEKTDEGKFMYQVAISAWTKRWKAKQPYGEVLRSMGVPSASFTRENEL